MEAQHKLNNSSPIVQRVYHLRERMVRNNAAVGLTCNQLDKLKEPVDTDQAKKRYQWQMWQKSDFPSYDGDESGHNCT